MSLYLCVMLFPPESRTWVYVSSRAFDDDEVSQLNHLLQVFCEQWVAHGNQLAAQGTVLHNRFIVLMVNEAAVGASGCSIDSSVRFLKKLEKDFNTQLFSRMILVYQSGDSIVTDDFARLQSLFDQGKIKPDTLVYDASVTTKKEYDERFMIPLRDSWMMRRIQPAHRV